MTINTTPLEEDEQKAVVVWLKLYRIPHFATINHQQMSSLNRRAAAKIQAKQRSLGMRPGVYDLCIFLPKVFLHIDMKRQKGGVVSEKQRVWGNVVNKFSYVEAIVCRGADEAIQAVKDRL